MAVIEKTKDVEKLERLETEINTEAFEAFYHIGQKLLRIKTDRLYESAGFKSWAQYCASGRVHPGNSDSIGQRQADNYIRAAELRPKLGTTGNSVSSFEWTQRHLLELCKCETDNDAKRVAKKAIAIAEKTDQRVTARLIAEVRDGDDETGRAAEKHKEQLEAASLDKHLDKLADILVDWRKSLEAIDSEQWESVSKRILTRVRRESEHLTMFLKG